MNFVMTQTIYNLMVVINANKVANQNVNTVQIKNALFVLMVGTLQTIDAIKYVEMVNWLLLLKNNAMMAIIILMMGVMIANLNVIKIVSHVLYLEFVYFVKTISKWMKIRNASLYVETEQLSKDQKNVKISMILNMMVVINVCSNVKLIVPNAFKVSVKNVKKDMIQWLRDALKQLLQMKLMFQNVKKKNKPSPQQ
ncbi:unnamed protein product [Paramecium sonneborni]|uniref:Transmembrane protein n=1 Tax=Paramecium sonneborni TaxID=65129 RepID=A0A8S1RMT6_9CILI|nr:unnamed protein product [Paramecium sonneborni]